MEQEQSDQSIYEEMKQTLSKNDDERIEQVIELFNGIREDIIKAEGYCDASGLLTSLCKSLDLKYDDYCVLSAWLILNK